MLNPTVQPTPLPPQSVFVTLGPIICASVVTAICMYPFDILRALLMAGNNKSLKEATVSFYKANGLTAFLTQGLGAEMGRAIVSRILKFWCQPIMHFWLFFRVEKLGNPLTKGIAGAFATIPEIFAIAPFEVLKLAQQLDKTKDSFGLVSDIYSKRGLQGLYVGYVGMQMRQICWTSTFFFTLDAAQIAIEYLLGGKSVYGDVLAGFIAGSCGTMVNTWLDVVRTRIQKQYFADLTKNNSYRHKFNWNYVKSGFLAVYRTTREIYEKEGIGALWSGFLIKSVYMGGSGSFLAVLLPRFKKMWGID